MIEIEEHNAEMIWFRQVLVNHVLYALPPFFLCCISSSCKAQTIDFSKKSLTKPDKRFSLKNKIIYELGELIKIFKVKRS